LIWARHALFLGVNLVPHLVVEGRKQEFDRNTQDYTEAECIGQRWQTLAPLVVGQCGGILVAQQVSDMTGRKSHPPSEVVDLILVLVLVFGLPHVILFLLKSM
jgi:hypothetical protein